MSQQKLADIIGNQREWVRQRDAEIVRMRQELGIDVKVIAGMVGVTPQRVYQILNREGIRVKPEPVAN